MAKPINRLAVQQSLVRNGVAEHEAAVNVANDLGDEIEEVTSDLVTKADFETFKNEILSLIDLRFAEAERRSVEREVAWRKEQQEREDAWRKEVQAREDARHKEVQAREDARQTREDAWRKEVQEREDAWRKEQQKRDDEARAAAAAAAEKADRRFQIVMGTVLGAIAVATTIIGIVIGVT